MLVAVGCTGCEDVPGIEESSPGDREALLTTSVPEHHRRFITWTDVRCDVTHNICVLAVVVEFFREIVIQFAHQHTMLM